VRLVQTKDSHLRGERLEIIQAPDGPKMLIARMRIQSCTSKFAEDIPRASSKRLDDHNSGRLLLERCLEHWGVSTNLVEVLRTDLRAPYLSWLDGVWKNEPLPGISIGHCENWAVCALIEPGYWIGIDSEPKDRGIKSNAFDMMAKGEELNFLIENSKMAIEIWTAKEAVQKAERQGMNLNPRDIDLSDYMVKSFKHDDLMISVSWRKAGENPRTPEDDLLEATRKAMEENSDFSIGCNTVRNSL